MKYNINRKYSLPERFEMLDLGVAEDERDPLEILKELDKIAEEYKQKLQADTDQGEPSRIICYISRTTPKKDQ